MKTNSIANVGDDLLKQIQKSEASLIAQLLLLSINRKIAALTGLNEILHCLIEETVSELNAERGVYFSMIQQPVSYTQELLRVN